MKRNKFTAFIIRCKLFRLRITQALLRQARKIIHFLAYYTGVIEELLAIFYRRFKRTVVYTETVLKFPEFTIMPLLIAATITTVVILLR